MKLNYDVVVVVPCFNEGKRMQPDTWIKYLEYQPRFLFVFVNDGSVDDTFEVLRYLQTAQKNVQLIENNSNTGKAAATRKAMLYVLENIMCKAIAFIDADHSTPLSELDRLYEILRQNVELNIVMGSRVQMLGKKIKRNLFRHYVGRIIATIICKILQEPVYDTQCGLKVFRTEACRVLVQEKFITNWLFDVEFLARYKRLVGVKKFGASVLEVPVLEWTEKEGSSLRFYKVFSILGELYRLKIHYRFTNTLP